MMSKILMNITLFHTKLIVNTYTALSLPFYAIYQKPWRKIKLSNIKRTESFKQIDRVVWLRKGPPGHSPTLKCRTYLEALSMLDPSKQSIGIRDVLDEKIEYDEDGMPMVIDGRILKRIVLADHYRWETVGEVIEKIDSIAKGLYDIGVRKGDKVIIYAETSPDWFFTCLAISRLGAAVVTLFSNLGSSGIIYGINQTQAQYIITSEDLKDKMLNYLDKIPHIKHIVYFPSPAQNVSKSEIVTDVDLTSLKTLIEKSKNLPPINYELPSPDDLALIMYTSGTTSLPKAVMIDHKTLMSNINSMTISAEDNKFVNEDMILGSFLPLSHIFGFVFNIYMFINGAKIAFATPFTLLDSSPAHVPGQTGDLKLINPNLFVVVPLVLERFQKEIYAKLNQKGFLAAPLFTYFMDYKTRWVSRGFQTPIINRLICSKIRKEFGSNLQFIGVGGAALHRSIQSFIRSALDVKLINAYGCTETCGGVYMCNVNDLGFGVCGTPMAGVHSQLIDWPEGGYTTSDKPNQRGELVIGGDMVASGYYAMPEETSEAFYTDEKGIKWFYTGDIGEIDPEKGQLRIIDRKKDLAKLSNGEYVSLGKIETSLRSSRYVENICICTDLFSNDLVALISPNRKVLKELAKTINKEHLSHHERCTDFELLTIVHASIKETGKRANLKAKEIPARIALTPEQWLPDNNLLTAAFKLKRKNVYRFYEKEIKEMFDSILTKS
ncbi:Long-chain-fatty-acid--CoA ligase 4 [Sarcoptes scabiei]|uniref:long-chain-fatty-acid--CoA ligase n=1 Tax=Sarcoptes scabiei TaxID=52283 RepID=A0A834VFC0_SARSC|nr:Long-chain-fatty-acid--CoA ligase 4 [Sarcoptes scabiei]